MRKLRMHELGRLNNEAFKETPKIPVTVVIDNVRSLLNVGSVFRTCDAFLIEKIILCGLTPTPNKEMNKTALGATESMEWQYSESAVEAIQELKAHDYQIASVEQVEKAIPLQKLEQKISGQSLAVVFGHEVTGVSDEVLQLTDLGIEIPQFGTKHSFNISVCAGIVLWEVARQYHHL